MMAFLRASTCKTPSLPNCKLSPRAMYCIMLLASRHNWLIAPLVPRYISMIRLASSSSIYTPNPCNCAWNFTAPMPYPAPRIVVLPTNLWSLVTFLTETEYMLDAIYLYTSSPAANCATKSDCPANHASTRASI